MKKKISLILLSVMLVVMACFGLTACGDDECSHNIVTEEAVMATCITSGKTEKKYCKKCKEVIVNSTVIPATGVHAYSEWFVEKDATCESAGYVAHYNCLTCNKAFDANYAEITNVEVPKLAHQFGTLNAEVPATCTENGVKAHKQCSLCLKNYDAQGNLITNININAEGHKLGDWIAVSPATCTEDGSVAHYTCSVCEKNYKSDGLTEILASEFVIPATGHSYALGYSKDKDNHWYEVTCEHQDQVQKTAHDFTNGGVCSCGFIEPVVGHVCENGTLVSAKTATCQKEGNVKYYACDCGLNYSDEAMTDLLTGVVIPALSHDLTFVAGKSATCTATGTMAYYECENCNSIFDENKKVFTGSLIVSKLNHALGELIEGSAATCVTAGEKAHYTCANCNKNFADVNANSEISDIVSPATGRHVVISTITTPATCTANGVRTITCATCSTYKVVEEIKLLGHEWNVAEATCTQVQECTREGCDAQNSKSHTYNAVYSEATCESAETTVYTCLDCNDTYTVTGSLALGHSVLEWVEGASVAKENCTKEVSYSGTCLTCETTQTKVETVANHNAVASVTTDATCQSEGVKSYICTACKTVIKTENFSDSNAHNFIAGDKTGNVIPYTCANECGASKTELDYSSAKTTDVISTTDLADNEVKLEDASIKLDAATIGQLSEGAKLSADTLGPEDRADAIKDLSDEDKALLGDAKIYEFTMTDSQGSVTNFNGYVTVTIPYELGEDEDVDSIVIWYINGETPEAIDNVQYTKVGEKEYVSFQTNHFSRYTVSKITPAEACERFGCLFTQKVIAKTCTTVGYTLLTCSRCGKTETTNYDWAIGHQMEEATALAVAPSCETKGKVVYKCANCDFKFENSTPALGHKWIQSNQTVFSTCTKAGTAIYTCEAEGCTATYKNILPIKAHNYESMITVATCTEGGYTTYDCKDCDASYVGNETPAKGHSYELVVADPTCTENGSKTYVCVCGDEKVESIEKLGHSWDIPSATCGQGQKCLVCGANGAPATEAHVYEGGSTTCSVCGAGCEHTYTNEDAVKEVKATCTENGYTEKTCDDCGVTTVTDYVKALGHNGDMVCTVCGYKITSNSFFINAINSMLNNSFAIKLTDAYISVVSENSQDNVNISIKFAELSIGFTDSGELFGYGSGTFNYNDGREDSSMFAIIENGYMYAYGLNIFEGNSDWDYNRPDGWFLQEQTSFDGYAKTSLESLVLQSSNAGNGTVAQFTGMAISKLPDIVCWFRQEIKPLIDNVIALNNDSINDLVANVFERIFKMETTTDGYVLSLSADKMLQFVEDLQTKSIKDMFFGGSDQKVAEFAEGLTTLGETTIGSLLTKYEQKGISIKTLLDALNKVVTLVTDGQMTSIDEALAGTVLPEGATIEQMVDSMRTYTVNDLITMLMQTMQGSQDGSQGDQGSQVTITLEEIALMLVGSPEEEQPGMVEMTAFDLLAMFGITVDANMLGQIEGYVAMMDSMIKLEISTDKSGAVTNIEMMTNISMEGSNVMMNFELVQEYQLIGNYTEAIRKIEELYKKFELTTSNVDKFAVEIEKEVFDYQYDNYGVKEFYTEYEIEADAEGKVETITFVRVTPYTNPKVDPSTAGQMMIENAIVETCTAYVKDMMISSTTDCLSWHDVNVTFMSENTTVFATVKYVAQSNGKIIIVDTELLQNEDGSEVLLESETTMGYANFRFNAATGAVAPYRYEDTAHNFVLAKKATITDDCTAIYEDEYHCLECGMLKLVRYSYGHTGIVYEYDWEKSGDYHDCNEGVTVTKKCTDCGETLLVETNYEHVYYNVLSEDVNNVNACDYHAYCLSMCPCGQQAYATYLQKHVYEDHVSQGWESGRCEDCGFYAMSSTTSTGSTSGSCNSTTTHSIMVGIMTYTEDGVANESIYTEELTFNTKSHSYREYVSLAEGANSCNDGVIVTKVCRDCNSTSASETYGHHWGWVDAISLTEFGLTEGYFYIYGCACGLEINSLDVDYDGRYSKYSDGYLFDDSIMIMFNITTESVAGSCAINAIYTFTYGEWDVQNDTFVGTPSVQEFILSGGYEHDYRLEQTSSSSCWYTQICNVCGARGSDVENHNMIAYTVVEAGCAEVGLIRWGCTNCGYYHTETAMANGHNFVENGEGGYICEGCSLKSDTDNVMIVLEDVSYKDLTENGSDDVELAVNTDAANKFGYNMQIVYTYMDGEAVAEQLIGYPEFRRYPISPEYSYMYSEYIVINRAAIISEAESLGREVLGIMIKSYVDDGMGGQTLEIFNID